MKKDVSIHIGELYASARPTIIYTLLGSCVAVCLYDPVKRIGGMNHILLPGYANLKKFNQPARFGINAIEALVNRIMNLGGDRRRLVAKIFGGAHVLSNISPENGMGRKIAAFVLEVLYRESFPIVSKDLGGERGRRVFFDTDTGIVFVQRIRSTLNRRICEKEKKQMPEILREVKKPGQITLFKYPDSRGVHGL